MTAQLVVGSVGAPKPSLHEPWMSGTWERFMGNRSSPVAIFARSECLQGWCERTRAKRSNAKEEGGSSTKWKVHLKSTKQRSPRGHSRKSTAPRNAPRCALGGTPPQASRTLLHKLSCGLTVPTYRSPVYFPNTNDARTSTYLNFLDEINISTKICAVVSGVSSSCFRVGRGVAHHWFVN